MGTIIITLIVIGILLWCLNEFVPMDAKIRKIINIVVVVLVVLWILRVMGAWSYLNNVKF